MGVDVVFATCKHTKSYGSHGPLILDVPTKMVKMVICHSYVSFPEGT